MDLTSAASAAAWLQVSADDPVLMRLVSVANSACSKFLDLEADFEQVPPDVEQAALEVVANLWRNRTFNPNVYQQVVGDASVTFANNTTVTVLTPFAIQLLSPYRRVYLTATE